MAPISAPSPGDVFALLDNTRDAGEAGGALLFADPVEEILCGDGEDIRLAMGRLDELRRKGLHVCGYITYEAGYFLADTPQSGFEARVPQDTPLMHFYGFRHRREMGSADAALLLEHMAADEPAATISDISPNMGKTQYLRRVAAIREAIHAGETYQVNFTLKYRFRYQGSPLRLFRQLQQAQRVEYGAFLQFPEFSVLSLSPELFVRKQGHRIEAKPMKGTFPRGANAGEDEAILGTMREDLKTRSENVMIVDLIRNDIGRIAQTGTVRVSDLFEIQTFETLHQMISTVRGTIAADTPVADIMRELFPCGSITGAPKVRTMQIIESRENEPRGIYTGAIGYLTPDNDFCFNVAIRTCIARADGSAEMGVGGGILAESDPQAEFEECALKARFLTTLNDRFQLIESMRYDARHRSIPRLPRHLARLDASARSLGFACPVGHIRQALDEAVAGLSEDHKLKLTLARDGTVNVSAQRLDKPDPSATRWVNVSDRRLRSGDVLLAHKTTERRLYEDEHRRHAELGAYDVLFANERGELAEASRHNLFIEKDGYLYTPPLSAGLLGGVERSRVMDEEAGRCLERSLTASDVLAADRVFLTNAVRGVVEVFLSEQARNALTALSASQGSAS